MQQYGLPHLGKKFYLKQRIFLKIKISKFFGGEKNTLTLIAMRYPSISIDASLSFDNYIMGNTKLSQQNVFYDKPKKPVDSQNFRILSQ